MLISQDHRRTERPKNTWKRDPEKEVDTVDFKYSMSLSRKIEMAAKDRDGWIQVVCAMCSTNWSDKA